MSPALHSGLWMMGAVVSFTLMAISGRVTSTELDTFELMTYRSAIGVIIMSTVAAWSGGWRQLRTQHIGLHVTRNLFHFAGQNLWFYALPLIPLAQLFAFEFTLPIWVVILAPFLLGERITRLQVLMIIIGFAGVLMVARPDVGQMSGGTIAAALCAIGFAMSAILTKKLTQKDGIVTILFYLTLIQLIFGIVMAGHDGDFAVPSNAVLPFVFIVGICGLTAHLSITMALRIAPASVAMPFDFIRLPVIMMVGYFLYQETIDGWTLFGALFILFANYLNLQTGRKHDQKVTE